MFALAPSGKLGLLGISVAALAAALSLPSASPASHDPQRPADHPVAALAWARTNCNAGLFMKHGAYLEHGEVLMRIAAELDQARIAKPLEDVCRDAIAAAKPAIAHNPSAAVVAPGIADALMAAR